MEFLIAGIIATISGIIGAVGSNSDSDKAYKKADREQKALEKLYTKQQEEAELKYNEAKRQAEKNADEADLQANLTDLGQDIAETTLSNDINTAIDDLYLSQANDAWNWNTTNMQIASQAGASYAGLAGSGIRAGSSLSDAVLMESSLNSAQLQFSQDAKRRSDNNNLAGILNGLAGNQYGIMQNRIGADITRQNALDLRNSYAVGGYNYNLYKNQKDQMDINYNTNWKNYKAIKEENSGSNKFWKSVGSFFTAGTTGWNTGYNMGTTFKEMKTPDYNTKVGGK